jgi:hypothetical protein
MLLEIACENAEPAAQDVNCWFLVLTPVDYVGNVGQNTDGFDLKVLDTGQ